MHDILFRYINSIVGLGGKVAMGFGSEYIPGQVIISSTARSEQTSAMLFSQEFIIDCLGTKGNPWLANENAQLVFNNISAGQNKIENSQIKGFHVIVLPYDNGYTPNKLKVVSLSMIVTFITQEVNSLEVPI